MRAYAISIESGCLEPWCLCPLGSRVEEEKEEVEERAAVHGAAGNGPGQRASAREQPSNK